mmetsp:Transcript_4881/g.10930  ORF Transcript_4881/g.10930 Transcript_4881/m.10930 type:complete len:458 (-) Transcript_4881:819-2192(-)
MSPSSDPNNSPSHVPTKSPSLSPVKETTSVPDTPRPTIPLPTSNPTKSPTLLPTRRPTTQPTVNPTKHPTPIPTRSPTTQPTVSPTKHPTPLPTRKPTTQPTKRPTPMPTKSPTPLPTRRPTTQPTKRPSPRPTKRPTLDPTKSPTPLPTRSPTRKPTSAPTKKSKGKGDGKAKGKGDGKTKSPKAKRSRRDLVSTTVEERVVENTEKRSDALSQPTVEPTVSSKAAYSFSFGAYFESTSSFLSMVKDTIFVPAREGSSNTSDDLRTSTTRDFHCTKDFFDCQEGEESCEMNQGCGKDVPPGYYPDLTSTSSYCYCPPHSSSWNLNPRTNTKENNAIYDNVSTTNILIDGRRNTIDTKVLATTSKIDHDPSSPDAIARYESCGFGLIWDTHPDTKRELDSISSHMTALITYLPGRYGIHGLWGTTGGGCVSPFRLSKNGSLRPTTRAIMQHDDLLRE